MFGFGKVYNSFSELPGMRGLTSNLGTFNTSGWVRWNDEGEQPADKPVTPSQVLFKDISQRSSLIHAVSWTPVNQEVDPFYRTGGRLTVVLKDGGVYVYDAEQRVYDEMIHAQSPTSYWSKNVVRQCSPDTSKTIRGNNYKNKKAKDAAAKKSREISDAFAARRAELESQDASNV